MSKDNLPRAIALGYFDGVHVGHKALMEKARMRAKQINGVSAVYTFDYHPSSYVCGIKIPMLTANTSRADEIKSIGHIDDVIFGHFDENLRTMHWKDFIHEILIKQLNAKYIISGQSNRFGYKGSGTPQKMEEECKKIGIGYDCIPDVKIDGIIVSSTYIRSLITNGEMEKATKFLGHAYTISGIVEHGRNIGTKTLGVPTLNIPLPCEMVIPPYGVYISSVVLDKKEYEAVTNIGIKPTFEDAGPPTIEPHILDFEGNLYGKFISVKLHKFIRSEMAFDNTDMLKRQIEKDIKQTKEFFLSKNRL